MADARNVVVLMFILDTVKKKKSMLIIYSSRSRHRSIRHARTDHELKASRDVLKSRSSSVFHFLQRLHEANELINITIFQFRR